MRGFVFVWSEGRECVLFFDSRKVSVILKVKGVTRL